MVNSIYGWAPGTESWLGIGEESSVHSTDNGVATRKAETIETTRANRTPRDRVSGQCTIIKQIAARQILAFPSVSSYFFLQGSCDLLGSPNSVSQSPRVRGGAKNEKYHVQRQLRITELAGNPVEFRWICGFPKADTSFVSTAPKFLLAKIEGQSALLTGMASVTW